jgi:MOB kinase activator 1
VYGTVLEFCTDQSCPRMSAGAKFEYLWKDNKAYKTPAKLSAPGYIDMLMTWVEELLNDEAVFPTRDGATYPRGFASVVKNIFRRLFRVYAHVYYSHFDKVVSIGAEAHLNSCFKHFMALANEFELVDRREQEPLKDLIRSLLG